MGHFCVLGKEVAGFLRGIASKHANDLWW